ncbi:MAG: hypothetical protein CYG61_08225 [Actinobacteria bacterium]|nr:MAG: hypothetical protein CYG61_08225 [Actinomycetota bacterium]
MQTRRSRTGNGTSRAARVAAGVGLASALLVVNAPASRGAECPPDRPLCRLFSTPTTAPAPAPAPPPVLTVPSLPSVTVAPPPPPPAQAPLPRSVPEAAQRLLDLVNGERAKAGLGRLTTRGDVVAVALDHSNRMAVAGQIFHNDSYFSDAVRKLLNSQARGENVAQNSSIDDTHTRLMNSPGHRANILDPRFSVAGFAVLQAGDGRYFTTQNFLQPAAAPASTAPASAAPAAAPATPRVPAKPTAPRAVAAAAPAAVTNATSPPPDTPVGEATPATTGADTGDAVDLLRRLPDLAATPASSTAPDVPGRKTPTTWLSAAVLLALVALGTVQVGRGGGARVPAPR